LQKEVENLKQQLDLRDKQLATKAEATEARFLLLEAQVREEREARLKNISLEQQLKKQAKDRETDQVRFIAATNQLKAQLREKEAEDNKAAKPRLRRDYSKVSDQPVRRFGSQGTSDGQFQYPSSVVCNSRGEIIVADYGNHRIQVFDRDGKFLLKFGSGRGDNQFNSPCGVTVDQRNNQIVVADTNNHRIQVFNEKGTFLQVFGSKGTGGGQFNAPRGVVVDQEGNYVVADSHNNRIQIFDSQGQFVRKFGSKGAGNGQMNGPWGVGLMSNGNIVAEKSGNRLQIFDSQGNFVRIVGAEQILNPYQLFVDSDDNILVADYSNSRVQVFHQDGTHIQSIRGQSSGTSEIFGPEGVCMDGEGRIIVTECGQGGQRVSIF